MNKNVLCLVLAAGVVAVATACSLGSVSVPSQPPPTAQPTPFLPDGCQLVDEKANEVCLTVQVNDETGHWTVSWPTDSPIFDVKVGDHSYSATNSEGYGDFPYVMTVSVMTPTGQFDLPCRQLGNAWKRVPGQEPLADVASPMTVSWWGCLVPD